MDTRMIPLVEPAADGWGRVFSEALSEHDPDLLLLRLREAKDALMDRIEDSFDTASLSERRTLVAALGAICELERRAGSEAPTSPKWSLERGTA